MQTSPPANDARTLRIAGRRRLVMWGHAWVTLGVLFGYLYSVNFPLSAALVASPIVLTLIGVPVLVPYICSASYCWGLYTWQGDGPNLFRIALFFAFLIFIAVLFELAFLGVFGPVNPVFLIVLLANQTGAYAWANSLLLDVI